MTTPPPPPPSEPRPTVGRSSLAVALKDYTLIRPAVALSISAAALVAALVIGLVVIRSMGRTSETVQRAGQMAATLHGYSAALEVWRVMEAGGDPRRERPEAKQLRDSIRAALTVQFRELRAELTDPTDHGLVEIVLESLRSPAPEVVARARQAMIGLVARQDGELFAAAEAAQEAAVYLAVLLALAVVAAGTLMFPWRGSTSVRT